MSTGQITYDPVTQHSFMKMDDGSVYEFNAAGQLLSATVTHLSTPGGPATTTTTTYTAWDATKDHRPTAGIDPTGHAFTLAYPPGGHTIETMGDTTSEFDGNNHLVSVTVHSTTGGPDQVTTYSAWNDPQGRPTAGVDPSGHAFALAYPDSGHTIETMGSTVYDTDGNNHLVSVTVHSTTGGPDQVTTYSAWNDPQGRPTAGVDPSGHAFALAYPDSGPANGHTIETMGSTVYDTDGNNHLVSVTVHSTTGGPDQVTTYSAWNDPQGRPTAGVDPSGHAFTLAYPDSGHTIETMGSTVYDTDGNNHLVSVTVHSTTGGPDQVTTYSAWNDPQGRPTAGVDPSGHAFTLAYPDSGHTIETMGSTVYDTDGNNHLVSVTVHSTTGGPDQVTTYSAWNDPQGRPTAGVDPSGHAFTLAYPDSGHTIETMGNTVYDTDGNNHLVSVTVHSTTGGPDQVTTYSAWNDPQGRPTAGVDPSGHAFTLAYPDNGHTIETMGNTVYDTDGNNHLVSVTVHSTTGGPDQVTTYSAWNDPQGRPTAGVDPSGHAFTLAYPDNGHTIETMGNTVYDTDGNNHLVSVTVHSTTGGPDQVTTYSAWNDPQGRPTAGVDAAGHAFTLAYLANGDTAMTMGNSVYTTNSLGQLVSVTVHSTTGGPDTTTTYSAWDAQNRPIAGAGPDGDFTISYDPTSGDETITFISGSSKNTIVVLTPDGKLISTTLPDGTFIDWKVQLAELYNAVQTMPRYQEPINEAINNIYGEFDNVRSLWSAPASASFEALATQFTVASSALQVLLSESVDRMKKSYLNIVEAETINAQGMPATFSGNGLIPVPTTPPGRAGS